MVPGAGGHLGFGALGGTDGRGAAAAFAFTGGLVDPANESSAFRLSSAGAAAATAARAFRIISWISLGLLGLCTGCAFFGRPMNPQGNNPPKCFYDGFTVPEGFFTVPGLIFTVPRLFFTVPALYPFRETTTLEHASLKSRSANIRELSKMLKPHSCIVHIIGVKCAPRALLNVLEC